MIIKDIVKISNRKVFLTIWVFILFLSGCTLDLLDDRPTSKISLVMDSGPYAGQQMTFSTSNGDNELQYYINKNTTRLFCQGLKSQNGHILNSSSSVNSAWVGNPGPGTFNAINFTNPTQSVSGDFELSFVDGEFIGISIPAGTSIQIDDYGPVGALVKGSMEFTVRVVHEKNGSTSSYQSFITIEFEIPRGQDVE